MKKFTDLGTVIKRHVSGMAETDTGNRFPASTDVGKGDQLVEVEGRKMFISKDEWAEMNASATSNNIRYKAGVTKALRDEAASFGIEVYETTTKDELIAAINEAKAAKDGDK